MVMSKAIMRYFVILSLVIGAIWAKIHISKLTESKEVGDYLSVLCKDDTGGRVMWKGPRNRIYGESTTPYVKMTTFGVHLVFNKLKLTDGGVYVCKSARGESVNYTLSVFARDNDDDNSQSEEFEAPIRPNKPTIIKSRPVFVLPTTFKPYHATYATSPPSSKKERIEFKNTPESVTGSEGSNIFLKCEAVGADVTEWTIDGENLQQGDPRYQQIVGGLLIRKATLEDADKEFECKAIGEGAGDIESRIINVTVTHKPKPKYEKANVLYGFVGGYVNLTCEVEAVPPPTFRWEYKKKEKQKFKPIGKEVYSDAPANTSVLMLYLNEKSFGDYQCIATNAEGETDIQFSLEEGTQPQPPLGIDIVNVTANEVFLTIEEPKPTEEENRTGMVPMGIQVEFREADQPDRWDTWEFELDAAKMYVIYNLTEETEYIVQAATINLAGISEYVNASFTTTARGSLVNKNCNYLLLFLLLCCCYQF